MPFKPVVLTHPLDYAPKGMMKAKLPKEFHLSKVVTFPKKSA
jgi:hypothetical protein